MNAPRRSSLIVLALTLALCACEQREAPPAAAAAPTTDSASDAPRFADQGASTGLRQQRQQWHEALETLLETPTRVHLQSAREQWSALYLAFNQAYLGLATRACSKDRMALLDQLDHWPWYPAYVDALPAWPDSGLINDPALALNADSLRAQQGATDDGEVALGFQPLWLMLAGAPDAPRRIADLQPGAARQADRRRQYLHLSAAQLESDLTQLDGEPTVRPEDLRCALAVIDQRLERLHQHQGATDPTAGLYLDAHSGAIIGASQPAATLAQLSAPDNAALRAGLEQLEPGFQAALENARRAQDWAPLAAWLPPTVP
ncbi:hypothetical protein [Alloalcanivorax mobilis]|uniref:hypothetical protein n=1 Tax=Alloalcanivorax mobilis TaxID=2019569 RepID=UPI000C75955B|nr:hypothetical protein [Alloalcanivorax mobilis]